MSKGYRHPVGGRGCESVSAGVSPVVLVDYLSTGYITVVSASRPPAAEACTGGSCLPRRALSASELGDFRPVIRGGLQSSPNQGAAIRGPR